MNDSMLAWILLVPSAAGLIGFLWPRRASWFVGLLATAVSLWLTLTAGRLLAYTHLSYRRVWVELEGLTLAADLRVTRFGAVIALFAAAFGVLICLYGLGMARQRTGRHYAYMLWTLAGALGAALANNLIVLLLCWEITTLMLFLLILEGGPAAKAGAAKTFAVLGFSDCCMLLAVGLILFAAAEPDVTLDRLRLTVDSPLTLLCFLLLLAAALAKAGAIPFHTWIPAAVEGAPTDVMAFLPASLDKLLGIYLLARCSLEFFAITRNLQLLLMTVGVVTIIAAVMMALIQTDLKKLLAYQLIAQVGYMALGIGTGSLIGIAGALFHMVNHALYKSCLFLAAGSVQRQTRTTRLDELGGLARYMPLTFTACLLAGLALAGVPPLNSFTSKWLIYQACLEVPSRAAPLLVTAAVFGSALTLACFVKVIHSVFLGRPAALLAEREVREAPLAMTAPMLFLALVCVVFGVFATLPLGRFIAPAMETVGWEGFSQRLHAGEVSALGTLWNPVLATGLMLAAFGLGLLVYAWGRGFRVRTSRVYLGGERLPLAAGPCHYSGTSFFTTVRSLPGLRAVFRDAEKESFDLYRISGRLGGSLVEVLRRTQTGQLPLYISWVVLGLVIIVVFLVFRHLG